MCVCICLYTYVCTSVWMHVEVWGWCWELPWSLLDLIHQVRVSQPTPELADMTTFLTNCFGIPCFSLLRLELQADHHAYQAFMWASGEPNSGPHSLSLADIYILKLPVMRTAFCISLWLLSLGGLLISEEEMDVESIGGRGGARKSTGRGNYDQDIWYETRIHSKKTQLKDILISYMLRNILKNNKYLFPGIKPLCFCKERKLCMHNANSDSHNLDLSHNLEQYHLSSGVVGRDSSHCLAWIEGMCPAKHMYCEFRTRPGCCVVQLR